MLSNEFIARPLENPPIVARNALLTAQMADRPLIIAFFDQQKSRGVASGHGGEGVQGEPV